MKREVKLKAIRQPKGKEEKTMTVTNAYSNDVFTKSYANKYTAKRGFERVVADMRATERSDKVSEEKGSAKLGYLVTCHLRNGNIIPAFTDAFSSAMTIADMFKSGEYTVKVEILKISTGSIFRYVV